MISGIDMSVPMIAGLLDSIIEEMGAKDRREHERRDEGAFRLLRTLI